MQKKKKGTMKDLLSGSDDKYKGSTVLVLSNHGKQSRFYFPVAGSDSKLRGLSAHDAYTK